MFVSPADDTFLGSRVVSLLSSNMLKHRCTVVCVCVCVGARGCVCARDQCACGSRGVCARVCGVCVARSVVCVCARVCVCGCVCVCIVTP